LAGNARLIKSLLGKEKERPDIFETVAKASLTGKLSLIRQVLLAHPEMVNARHKSLGGECDESTPLHYAVMKKDIAIVRLLLDYGADVNARNTLGHTPLHIATCIGEKYAMELLIGKGASLEAPDRAKRETPLHYAVARGDAQIIELLLERGAYINAQNKDGETPLHIACKQGREDIATLLLAAGAEAGIADDHGNTPLRWAMEQEMDVVTTWYRVHHPDAYEAELEDMKKRKEQDGDMVARDGSRVAGMGI